MNTREKVPIHKGIITPLVIGSKNVIFHFFGNQFFIWGDAQILVGYAPKFKGILVEHCASFHGLHANERAEPEVEASSDEIDGCVG